MSTVVDAKICLLLVGNFLSSSSFTPQVCEAFASKLAAADRKVLTTSDKLGRIRRLADMLVSTWRWRRAYRLAYVEVFSGHAFFWAEAVCSLLRALGKPYVLTLHGGGLPEFAQEKPKRVGRLLASAAAVTAPSAYLMERLRPNRVDIRYIPNAIELDQYPFRVRVAAEPKLVWMRAFHEIYNPGMAIRVAGLLVEDFPDLQLQMMGPDKDGSQERTRNLANELGAGERFFFPGRIAKAEVPARLNEGDIFLNTTNVDNTPVSVIEAMACGMCVVSTNVGGIPYLLEHEVDALLVPPGDAEAMAAAVRRLLTEPRLAERLSRNARRKVEAFDWSVVLPQWEALFAAVAAGR